MSVPVLGLRLHCQLSAERIRLTFWLLKGLRMRAAQGQVQVAVRKLLCKHGAHVGSISVTGHSLGGALASLCAFDIANSKINHQVPLTRTSHICRVYVV